MRNQNFFYIISFLFITNFSYAAQDGKVVALQGHAYEQPDKDSELISTVVQGSVLRMSDKNREGFYKVLLPETDEFEPQTAWMPIDEISPIKLIPEMRAANIQLGTSELDDIYDEQIERNTALSLYWHTTTFAPDEIQKYVGDARVSIRSSQPAIEYTIRTKDAPFGVGFHYTNLRGSDSGYTIRSHLLTALLEYYLINAAHNKLSVGLGGGVGTYTSVSVGVPDSSNPTVISRDTKTFMIVQGNTRVSYRQYLSNRFGIVGNAGYRFINQSGILLLGKKLTLNMSGVYFEGGFFLDF